VNPICTVLCVFPKKLCIGLLVAKYGFGHRLLALWVLATATAVFAYPGGKQLHERANVF
jgi:hypothetical protein